MGLTIREIRAWEILDSRGNPTVAARCTLSNEVSATAHAPSGASTGRYEAVELRDGDGNRYRGKGVLRAVGNINHTIAPILAGWDATDQVSIDRRMVALDGTPDKSRLGANAILAASCAVARAAARALGVPLWKYLSGNRTSKMPLPMINIFSGGKHAGANIEFQDFLVMPRGIREYSRQLEAVCAIHRAAHVLVLHRGYILTGVADEGGWGPRLESNEQALALLTEAIERAGFRPGEQITIALDVAASHFYRDGEYHLATEHRTMTSAGMIDLLGDWSRRYPVSSIEDGLHEDDWNGWRDLTSQLGQSLQLVGDDFFTTNLDRLNRGIAEHAANAVLVKMNQIGTLTETFAVIDRAAEAGFAAVISARSGETEDDFLADLAVASGAGQIKVGSVTRSERLSKYNRLIEIQGEMD